MLEELGALRWFNADASPSGAGAEAMYRRRVNLSPQTAFRGLAPGNSVGPYLSQLLLVGSPSATNEPFDGIIEYGAQTIDQRVRQVGPTDFMTSWDEWFDVANALSPSTRAPDTAIGVTSRPAETSPIMCTTMRCTRRTLLHAW